MQDATRQFRCTVYCPLDKNRFNDDGQLTLEEAWCYYMDTGMHLFLACDAQSLKHNFCVLNMERLTPNEQHDLWVALKG